MKPQSPNVSHFSLCLWTLISLGALIPLSGHADDLLKNGSFENDSPYTIPPNHDGRVETLQAEGWLSYAGATLSDKKSNTGDRAAKFEVTDDASRGAVNFHMAAMLDHKQLMPGDTVKASCWVLNEGLSFPQGNPTSFTIELLNQDGAQEWINVPLPSHPSGAWEQVEGEIVIPEEFDGSWRVRVGIKIVESQGLNIGSGTVYFDDFEAEIVR